MTPAALHDFCVDALRRAGASDEHARTTAEVMVMTDTWGTFTHGSKLLPGYIRRIRAGGIRAGVEPHITSQGPAWAMVDAESVLGQVSSVFAMKAAIEKARSAGMAYVGVRNGNHFGAAGYYAWLAAKQGLLGMAMSNDIPSVAAPGSRAAVLGSNPIAYAIPTGGGEAIILDMATSTVAGGKVYAARVQGKPIPPDWLIGPDGLPTTDGSLYPQTAVLNPMAGHKGYGVALLIESLAGVLTGAAVTWKVGSWIFGDPSLPTHHGAAFLAFDLGAMMPADEFRARVDALVNEIHAAPTAPGVKRVRVPGEPEWDRRKTALVEGIPLPEDVRGTLRKLAADLGMEPPAWL
jgi:LDH2 family malate/lactate/ureidoglycolate dehydrogenase